LSSRTQILVVSNDGYADLWQPFFKYFFHYWHDCPLKINLLTNSSAFNHSKVKSIQIGPDISWSDNLILGLNKIDCDYIILFIEDLFLKRKVDNQNFDSILKWVNDNRPDYVQFNPTHRLIKYDRIMGKLHTHTAYRTSLLPCIWRKERLIELLKPGESAWDFETKGSIRAYNNDKFFATHTNIFNYFNSVIKGKWRKSVAEELARDKIKIDISSRKIMNNKDEFIYSLIKMRSKVFNLLPARLRGYIKELNV